jgi:hypothetical protein
MQIWPTCGKDWFAVLLIPFKIFVPSGYLMVLIQKQALGYHSDFDPVMSFVLPGYIVTFFVLLLGASVQYFIGPEKAYRRTCAFATGVFVFGYLLLPYLARA